MITLLFSLDPLRAYLLRPPERGAHGTNRNASKPCTGPRPCSPLRILLGLLAVATLAPNAIAQGPMPEEGATLFPHGAFLSYNSVLTSYRRASSASSNTTTPLQPTFLHEMPLAMSWSPRRDLQLTFTVPFVRESLRVSGHDFPATGPGDATAGVKYRFLRRDSKRGTTQASLEAGPKFPTGSTTRHDPNGNLLPLEQQLGSGSLDWRFAFTTTYTGLFGVRRLVADVQAIRLQRTENGQGLRLGDLTETRLWIHFRPLQTKLVGGEWFIGPDVQWKNMQPVRAQGADVAHTGNDVLAAGITTYISPRGGLTFWASALVPVRQDWNGAAYEQRARFSFGITKQFAVGH